MLRLWICHAYIFRQVLLQFCIYVWKMSVVQMRIFSIVKTSLIVDIIFIVYK